MTGPGLDTVRFLLAFARARWGYRFKDRAALLAHQQARIAKLLRRRGAKAAFYRERLASGFEALPIVSKHDVLAAFERFNCAGIELAQAQRIALRAERDRDFTPTLANGISVGSSSGTSGRPSVFLVSRRERCVWAGTVLGRLVSTPLLRRILNPFAPPVRIAFFLRANSNLYTTLRSRRTRFEYFDLSRALHGHTGELCRLSPDILVAPASVLRHLAEWQQARIIDLHPAQVISVAETLEEDDVRAVRAAWGVPTQQVYQCTEGFLGYSCAFGSLHLNEEFVRVEHEPLEAQRFAAVITDFSRSTQLFVRYRMDDVLRLDPRPCACGRVTARLASIEGRQDDVLWLSRLDGHSLQPVFPDQLRRAMMLAVPELDDYRLRQRGATLELALRGTTDKDKTLAAVRREIRALCRQLELREPQLLEATWTAEHSSEKRRRIRCLSRPLQAVTAARVPAARAGIRT
jgi:putative adenylate-forming enzyme